MPELTLGDRIGQIRRRRSMTQEELAERAGISADVIRKLEQNRRTTAAIKTLHAIARALEVETSELLKQGVDLDNEDNGDAARLLELRRILTPSLAEAQSAEEPPTNDKLRADVLSATRAYQDSQYRNALGHIAVLLSGVEAAASVRADDYETRRIVTYAYITAARTLIQLRREDLGYEAVRRSLTLAEKAGDEVLYATCGDAMNWILIRQARFSEAEKTATKLASVIEPKISSKDGVRFGTWGRLQMQASTAAARNNRPTQAAEYLTLARTAAARVDGGQMSLEPYQQMFSQDIVSAIEVESALVAGEPDRALHLADSLQIQPWEWGSTWERHLLTVAEAQVANKNYADANQTIMEVRGRSSEWLVNQRLARRLVRDLLDSRGVRWARNSGLADLASEMKIAV
ncbi:helix-turn-helix transcriptional regulator [Pseudofrankia sp. BMG5.36]|uniref:helix-turn-helix domain-containing protein n=1 Tax=Pseudofrankia sp. BMG5.36 TaxID=1834512 RepID=UPI001041D7A0|nr:helix-turn-helix transcriptional regulator [Pseudofrankia sp. BMG5.36]